MNGRQSPILHLRLSARRTDERRRTDGPLWLRILRERRQDQSERRCGFDRRQRAAALYR
jgi:hypothetical protein